MTTRQLSIKNKNHYFYNDLINLSNFEDDNLKLDKKSWKDIDFIILVILIRTNDQNGMLTV